MCIAFDGCGVPYALAVHHYLKNNPKAKPTVEDQLRLIVDQLNEEGIRVRQFVADTPERQFCKGMTTFHAYNGCDYCLSRGVYTAGSIRHLSPSMHCSLRTHEQIELQAELPCRKLQCGVKYRSPLLDLPDFNIVLDTVLDHMHLVPLGLTKLILDRLLALEPSLKAEIDAVWTVLKLTSEHAWRTRSLTYIAKASEFHNLGYCVYLWLFLDCTSGRSSAPSTVEVDQEAALAAAAAHSFDRERIKGAKAQASSGEIKALGKIWW